MNRRLQLAVLTAALVGAALGLLAPKATAGPQGMGIDFLPPSHVDGNEPQLTTGWHATFGVLNALDWGRFDKNRTENLTAYLRGKAYRGALGSTSSALIYQDDSTDCYRVRADFYDDTNDVYRGTIFFTHVTKNVTDVTFTHSTSGQINAPSIGVMRYPDMTTTCPSDAWHIHQYYVTTSLYNVSASGSWVRNTSKYSATDQWKYFLNTDSTNWTHKVDW